MPKSENSTRKRFITSDLVLIRKRELKKNVKRHFKRRDGTNNNVFLQFILFGR